MNDCSAKTSGITPPSCFPECPIGFPCTEICETDKLCIPKQKYGMEDIIEVFVSLSICSFKTICTPAGRKLIINGIKHIKVVYTADAPCQNVCSAHFSIPFCNFILLGEHCHNVIDVCTAIEYICVKQLSCRCFSVSTIFFACPVFEKDHDCHNKYKKKFAPKGCSVHMECNMEDNCSNGSEDCKNNERCRHTKYYLDNCKSRAIVEECKSDEDFYYEED